MRNLIPVVVTIVSVMASKFVEAIIPVLLGGYLEYALLFHRVMHWKLFVSLGAVAFVFIAHLFQNSYFSRKVHQMLSSYRQKVLKKLLLAEPSFLKKKNNSETFSELFLGLEKLGHTLAESLLSMIGQGMLLIGVATGILWISGYVAMALYGSITLIITMTLWHRKKQKKKLWTLKKKERALSNFLWESEQAKQDLAIFCPKANFQQKLNTYHKNILQASFDTDCQSIRFIVSTEVLQALFLVSGLMMIVYFKGAFIGDLFAFSLYSLIFFRPLLHILDRFDSLQESYAHFEKARSYFSKIPERWELNSSGVKIEELEIKNLQIIYTLERPLGPFSFKLSKGHVLFLKGNNGIGKSSLLTVLSGEEDRFLGDVLLDNQRAKPKLLREIAFLISSEDRILASSLEDLVQENFWESFPERYSKLIAALKSVSKKPLELLDVKWHYRFLFLKALACPKEIYLFDEVFSKQDFLLQEALYLFLEHEGKNAIVLIASHEHDLLGSAPLQYQLSTA